MLSDIQVSIDENNEQNLSNEIEQFYDDVLNAYNEMDEEDETTVEEEKPLFLSADFELNSLDENMRKFFDFLQEHNFEDFEFIESSQTRPSKRQKGGSKSKRKRKTRRNKKPKPKRKTRRKKPNKSKRKTKRKIKKRPKKIKTRKNKK